MLDLTLKTRVGTPATNCWTRTEWKCGTGTVFDAAEAVVDHLVNHRGLVNPFFFSASLSFALQSPRTSWISLLEME
jgi:hypothetical protein